MAANGDNTKTLDALRARIDGIDADMHRLLIERSSVIDALIAAKGTSAGGVAFRPQREAEMMRRIAARHEGNLPLATVEHLWREIISTFTYMQAPFRLVVHYGDDPVVIHDLARFAFGFSVELVQAESPEEVAKTVAATGSDLGLIPLQEGPAPTAWWRSLTRSPGPRIMAIWPFLSGVGPTASAVILSPPLSEPVASDIAVFAAEDDAAEGTAINDAAIIAERASNGRRDLLIGVERDSAAKVLEASSVANAVEVGGVAKGVAAAGHGDILHAPIKGDR